MRPLYSALQLTGWLLLPDSACYLWSTLLDLDFVSFQAAAAAALAVHLLL